MLTYNPDVVSLRKLNTTNITRRELDCFLENIESNDKIEYDYISSHHWLG